MTLPSLLADCTAGRRTVTVTAHTLQGCLDTLISEYPLLKKHLFEETGNLRQHVNLFYNGDNIRWIDDWGIPLELPSTLTIVQAVSGG